MSKEQQDKLQSLVSEKLENPGWEVTARETQEGIDCLTGKTCPHGPAQNLVEVPVTAEAKARVQEVLINNVLPALAEKVKPETITTWNNTIGKVVGIQAK